MRKMILTASIALMALAASAVPAKRGLWRNIQLAGGGTARVQLVGDEHIHFYVSEDGTRYSLDSATGLYSPMSDAQMAAKANRAAARRKVIGNKMRPRRVGTIDKSVFQGTKKAIVILAQYTDKKFTADNNLDLYKKAINGINYKDGDFRGSVRDYFRAQSNGQFDIDFDVVGVCPLKYPYSHYGKNVGDDEPYTYEMIVEACQWAHNNGTDFSKYDWNGDGKVDQVYVIYAGLGEADGGTTNTVWPHMFYLSAYEGTEYYGKGLTLDGVAIDTYACGPELQGDGRNNGVGTFCHEFSHCMGFPDLYDYNSSWFGMGYFDLMDSGSYNGDGYLPAGYSAAEKSDCGWIELKDMTNITETVNVTGMAPQTQNGDAYIIKNKGNENEYFVVEYRAKDGWDAEIPGEGIMITHIDFDQDIWDYNTANTKGQYYKGDKLYTNNHMRWTIKHANNSTKTDYDYQIDALYPYNSNNKLTRTSKPTSSLYNTNSDGTNFMHVDITNMAVDEDNAVASLSFVPYKKSDTDNKPVVPEGDYLLKETFDGNNSEGGNDDKWNAITSVADPVFDNEGWTSANDKIYGANMCIRIGTSNLPGTITSPTFTVNGTATLSFKAGAWDSKGDGKTLTVTASNGSLSQGSFDMTRGAWTNYSTTITATGNVKLTFTTSAKRFFLDDVYVTNASTGIVSTTADTAKRTVVGYFGLDGTRLQTPRKGVNIVKYADGSSKKVVVM
ncbi:M6 family metalloprotease domain-containing protein [uncultured Prevotella sp.]|uniref:M6 family metalloprotease domain-containing protein n=1 Tax=uncultured Prevotella sp. TaxID=159272 RepID=UPI0025D87ADF|nr:M6 family metalloprotease domain-containing protein [uncultured Prevotella sp.]